MHTFCIRTEMYLKQVLECRIDRAGLASERFAGCTLYKCLFTVVLKYFWICLLLDIALVKGMLCFSVHYHQMQHGDISGHSTFHVVLATRAGVQRGCLFVRARNRNLLKTKFIEGAPHLSYAPPECDLFVKRTFDERCMSLN